MIRLDLDEVDRLVHLVMPALWRSSWQAAVLAAAVLVLQLALGKRLAPRWRHAMWWVVLLRLLIPVTPPSRLSLFNAAPEQPAIVSRGFVLITQAVPPPPSSARIDRPHDLLLILAAVWAVGLLWMLGRIALASAMLSLAVRRMSRVVDAKVLSLLERCRAEMGVRRDLVVLTSPMIGAPALMGCLRPRLLLPPTVLEHFDVAELRLILLHELAHLKRHDVAINWLASILQAIHWFNPIVHLAFARLKSDRELAADELVLSHTGDEQRAHYGDTLIKLLQTLSRRPALCGTVGILERAHPMRRRITMIAQFHRHAPRWSLAAAACLLILAALGLTDRVRGQSSKDADPHATTRPSAAATTEPTVMEKLRARREAELAQSKAPPATQSSPSSPSTIFSSSSSPAAGVVSVSSPDDDKLRAMLQKRLPEINFNAIGFSDTVDFFRDVTNANVTVNWRALEAAGIDRNAPCTLRLKDVTFEQALTHLLRDVGGGTVTLAFAVSDGSIVISTADEFSRNMELRTYIVTDLLNEQDKGSAVLLANVIVAQVTNSQTMIVTPYHDRLVVKATPLQQREVEAFLAELRKKPQEVSTK